MSGRVLVAGVGNVFFGDDAFGVEVVNYLATQDVPHNAVVKDFGIRGMHLAYEIAEGYDAVIFVDAVGGRTGEPGTIYVIEPDRDMASGTAPDAHTMDLKNVFAFLAQLGGSDADFYVVGCKPQTADEGMGLSPVVASAIPAAAAIVLDIVGRYANSKSEVVA